MMSIQMEVEKPKTSRSLAATLAIAFLALSVVVLFIAGSSQMYFNIQTQREIVAGEQQLIAQDAANTVASFIQEKFSILETAVKFGNPVSASQEERRNVLESLLGLEPAFRQLVLLDSQEQELFRVSRLSQAASGKLTDRAGSDWFAQVKQGHRYIGPVHVDEVTSEPMVIMAVPVTNVFGDFQGTLMAEVNLKFMWDLVDRLEIGQTGLAYVVDRQGNLIAFGDVARVLRGENVGHLKEVGEFVSNPAPVDETGANISSGINGTTMVGTYVPLGAPDWAVVTELPVAEAYREVIRAAVISVGVMLVMAMLAGLIGVYVARRLAVPLLNLTGTATQIAGGEMGLQAAIEGPTEVASLATAFNSMTAQLRDLIGSLEQRVADRTRNLQTAAEVARATTSVLDPDKLLHQTVDLVRERLDLYYVGLFLLDEERRFAVLRAGTGEAGQKMLAQGHRLEMGGDSMIGQCTAKAEARIALDVGEEAARFDNPLLPETRSEMALPLQSRGRIIGAMTVQSVEEAAFDEADIAVMQTMADQVAVTIDNARLFAQAQAALEEMEATHRRYLGQAWTRFLSTTATTHYEHVRPGAAAVSDTMLSETREAIAQRQAAVLSSSDSEAADQSALVTPIVLRGQAIGALRLHETEGARQWTEDEIALVEAVSEQMALAAESLRLFEETQRSAARERLTREITDNIRAAISIEDAIQRAVREMGRALGASEMVARLGTARDLLSSLSRDNVPSLSSDDVPSLSREGDDHE